MIFIEKKAKVQLKRSMGGFREWVVYEVRLGDHQNLQADAGEAKPSGAHGHRKSFLGRVHALWCGWHTVWEGEKGQRWGRRGRQVDTSDVKSLHCQVSRSLDFN